MVIATPGAGHLAVGEAKIPAVIRADGTPLLHQSAGKIVPGMGTRAVQNVDFALMQKNRQRKTVDIDVLALALAQFVEITQTRPAHGLPTERPKGSPDAARPR